MAILISFLWSPNHCDFLVKHDCTLPFFQRETSCLKLESFCGLYWSLKATSSKLFTSDCHKGAALELRGKISISFWIKFRLSPSLQPQKCQSFLPEPPRTPLPEIVFRMWTSVANHQNSAVDLEICLSSPQPWHRLFSAESPVLWVKSKIHCEFVQRIQRRTSKPTAWIRDKMSL